MEIIDLCYQLSSTYLHDDQLLIIDIEMIYVILNKTSLTELQNIFCNIDFIDRELIRGMK